jgi:hypothetical protein
VRPPVAVVGSSGAAAAATLVTIPLVGVALVVGCRLGTVPTVVAVAVIQTVLVLTWVSGFAVPGRVGALLLGLAASAGADAVLVRWNSTGYEPVLAVLGLALPAMFGHQLLRGVMRARVVESLSDIAVLLLGVTSLSGLIVLRYQDDGRTLVTAIVAATAAGLFVDQLTDIGLPVLRFDAAVRRGLPGVLLGAVAGGALAAVVLRHLIDFTHLRAAFAGAVTAVVACLLSVGTSFAGASTTFSPAPAPVPMRPRAVPDDDGLPGSAPWPGIARLRPVACVLLVVALTTPAGYVLATSLSS